MNSLYITVGDDGFFQSTPIEKGDKWRKKIRILLVAVLVIAVAITVWIATSKPTDPTIEAFRNVLVSVSDVGLKNPNSPQFKALNWVAKMDPANTTVDIVDIEIIKQRYVAALLYFALGGEEWINRYNFLTEVPICSWNQELSGIICDSTKARVVMLNMSKNGLRGSIPKEIAYFSDLTTMEMTDGLITGTLPSSLAELNLLDTLNLAACELEGTIPDFLYTHEKLTQLVLHENSFTGTIPPSLGTSPQLRHFWVKNNKLTGSMPATVGQSSVLSSVDLTDNSLTGTIPDFSPSSQMFYLSLFNNQLTGDIGPVINTLPRSLTSLDLGYNRLIGTVPTSIGTLTDINWLGLQVNNLNGTIPTELGLLSKLNTLFLDSNRFTGTVPTNLASLPLLKSLLFYDNDLTGSLDAFCRNDYELFAANACGQDEIVCACCTHCCDPETHTCTLN